MLQLKYTIVDAFTSTVFAGNPAAVIVLPPEAADLPDAMLQLIAREFNLSETAFITSTASTGVYGLRWFTPTSEVKLCGHATLASAFALFALNGDGVSKITFQTRWSGNLETFKRSGGKIELVFPAMLPQAVPDDERERSIRIVRAALGAANLDAEFVGAVAGEILQEYLLVHLNDEFNIGSASVNASALLALAPRGIIILTNRRAPAGRHFASRVFGPLFGVQEDPVCGSAHCLLAPYWTQKLDIQTLSAKQVSARSGDLEVEWVPDAGLVKLRGDAVVAATGVISVPHIE